MLKLYNACFCSEFSRKPVRVLYCKQPMKKNAAVQDGTEVNFAISKVRNKVIMFSVHAVNSACIVTYFLILKSARMQVDFPMLLSMEQRSLAMTNFAHAGSKCGCSCREQLCPCKASGQVLLCAEFLYFLGTWERRNETSAF